MKEIYLGNLRIDVTVDEIRDLIAPYGTVYSIDLFAEPEPGHPHAFAFVKMEANNAVAAIRSLDGTEFFGLTLKVEPAIEQPETEKVELHKLEERL